MGARRRRTAGVSFLVTSCALTLAGCAAADPDAGDASEGELVVHACWESWDPGEPPPCPPMASDAGPPPLDEAGGPQPAAPSVTGTDQDADLPAPEPRPTWDKESRTSAEQTAEQAMTLFARPSLGDDRWWSDLAPQLSPAARATYAGVDPAEVLATEVNGPGVLVEEGSPWLADIDVPTDVGTYRLLLSRVDVDGPWLVEIIQPPPGLRALVRP